MNLIKGINIQSDLKDIYSNIEINTGVVHHGLQKAKRVKYENHDFIPSYESDAFVAKRDWRELKRDEKELLQNDEKRYYNTIVLGELPNIIKEEFNHFDFHSSKCRKDVFNKFFNNPEKTKSLSSKIEIFISQVLHDRDHYFHCVNVNLPNLELVACNTTKLQKGFRQEDIKYMGLHNDITQEMSIQTAHKFGNRISMNIGKDSRYLLFINLTMLQVYDMLKKKKEIDITKVNITNISNYFFKYYPNYPVIRIKIKPYHYYVAPTDNCFHDGSTLNSKNLDINIVYFGYLLP